MEKEKEMTKEEMKKEMERLKGMLKSGKKGRKEMIKEVLLEGGVGVFDNEGLAKEVEKRYGGDKMTSRNVSSILCYIKDDIEFNGGFYRKGKKIWWDVKK